MDDGVDESTFRQPSTSLVILIDQRTKAVALKSESASHLETRVLMKSCGESLRSASSSARTVLVHCRGRVRAADPFAIESDEHLRARFNARPAHLRVVPVCDDGDRRDIRGRFHVAGLLGCEVREKASR